MGGGGRLFCRDSMVAVYLRVEPFASQVGDGQGALLSVLSLLAHRTTFPLCHGRCSE
jgi:hypothetical protein